MYALFAVLLLALWAPFVASQEERCDELLHAPVVIEGSQAFLKLGNKTLLFPWHGIGYSPVPNSDDLGNPPFGDYFQSTLYTDLWLRDMALMQNMNASVVRIWSWNFILQHVYFLDALWDAHLSNCRPLRLMLPFLMTITNYPSLEFPDTRKQVLLDYEAFLNRYNDHPAIIAYMIGNELNRDYGQQLDFLFSILKDMIAIKNSKNITIPITLPLSGDSSFEVILDTYYDTTELDFWSVQVYDPERLTQVISYYRNRTSHNPKPLLISEFGVDAFGTLPAVSLTDGIPPTVNENLQAEKLNEMWQIIVQNNDIVMGGSVMEFMDEWWKGNFPLTSNGQESCPNLRYDVHNYCGNIIGNTSLLHEEWLGIFSQQNFSYFLSSYTYCIVPRQAFYQLRSWWSNTTGDLDASYCVHVGLTGAPFYLVATAIYVLALGLIFEVCYLASGKQKSAVEIVSQEEPKPPSDFNPAKMSKLLEKLIREYILYYTSDFTSYELVHMRIEALIWDKIASSKECINIQEFGDWQREHEENLLIEVGAVDDLQVKEKEVFKQAVSEVYFKYMEAYHLWEKNVVKDPNTEPVIHPNKMIQDLVLWNVVHQSAGTISHAPEKICQVFYFVKKYLLKRGNSHEGHVIEVGTAELEPQGTERKLKYDENVIRLEQPLLTIFKRYYADVSTKHVNYDDLNSDGLSSIINNVNWDVVSTKPLDEAYFMAIHEAKWKSEQGEQLKQQVVEAQGKVPLTSSVDGKAENPTSEVRQRPRRLHLPSFSKRIQHAPSTAGLDTNRDEEPVPTISVIHEKPTTTKKYFPNLGGVLGCIVCFSWLLRINVWIIVGAQFCGVANNNDFFSSESRCRTLGFPVLAFADAGIFASGNIFRLFVAGISNFTVLNYIKLVYSIAWFVFIIGYQVLPVLQSFEMLLVVYLGLAVILGTLEEFYINCLSCALPIPGRDDKIHLRAYVNIGFWFGNLVLAAVFALWKLGFFPSFLADDVVFFTKVFGINIPLFLVVCGTIAPFAGWALALGLGMMRVAIVSSGDPEKKKWLAKQVHSDIRYNFRLLLFWGSTFAIQWIFLAQVLVPSVQEITPAICQCEQQRLQTSVALAENCLLTRKLMCYGAVILMWISTILISYVSIFSAFNIILLIAGTYSAVQSQVGNVKTWVEVEKFFYIVEKNMVALSDVFKKKEYQYKFWNDFIESMYSEHLLSKAEREHLKYSDDCLRKPQFRPAPYSKEAQRRIIKFMWSLEAMLHSKSTIPEFRKSHMVRSMPTWTVMVPCHSETCVFLQEDLIRPQKGPARISTIEYLAATFPDEWQHLASELRSDGSANELLEDFLNTPILKHNEIVGGETGKCSPKEVDNICFWASYRGQTLVRTVKGLVNWRRALEKLAMAEEGVPDIKDLALKEQKIAEVQDMVRKKFQIILAYQIYAPNITKDWTKERDLAFQKLLSRFHEIDVVYNFDKKISDSATVYTSVMIRFLPNKETQQYQIVRPGPLVIGEPKAENQHHALAFAQGEVIQVNDMNMYASLENGFKIPFMLNQYFNTPEVWTDPAMLIPTYRIVGYPEHTYTKQLSTVGDLMGSAEFCFVTIMQRVLGFLRVRAHYGHPDFVDGYWARTRGGVSKASHLINTNEDIFSGYEIIGRGERIKYIEYIEQEKGRESAFDSAYIFEAKLAKGAAQQIKSPQVYLLNENLPLLVRLSLFFGSIGFYISTMLMSMSIDLYIYTILLYISAGVDYHTLGLLDAVIAVPWLLQVGYIQALPLLLESSIEQGIWEGLALFMKRLLFGIVFHVRTKSYYFAQGLLGGKGGYMATGRGFGLDRGGFIHLYKLYFDSHFNNAIILFVACMVYCATSTDSSSEIALRLASIILVVFSWLVAPVMFNPYPTYESQQAEFDQLLEWVRSPVDLKLDDRIKREISKEDTEAKRRTIINNWWARFAKPGRPNELTSFKAYIIKNTIEEWQAEDHVITGVVESIMLFIQKLVYFLWRYGVWILLCLPLYSYESAYYLFFIIECVLLSYYIGKRHGGRHEYFSAVQMAMLVIIAPLATVLHYSRMTLSELIVSMLLYMVIFYAIFSDLTLGFINQVLIKRFRFIEGAVLFPKRLSIPQKFYSLQKMWPFSCLLFLAVINTICVLIGNILTTLLYNGAVTDKWNRAYLFTKTNFVVPVIAKEPPIIVTTSEPIGSSSNSPSLKLQAELLPEVKLDESSSSKGKKSVSFLKV